MDTLTVQLGDRSYPIYIGAGLLGSGLGELLGQLSGKQVAVVTNPTIGALYRDTVLSCLAEYDVDVFEMPDGEAHKNLDTYAQAMDFLMEKRHNRSTTLFALGGGVVGDLTGFVAATFQRGVDFIQIPTTLLAQVDSSVGGKTAVNHPAGKNMIGAFNQPRAVVIDTDVLKSLPPREYAAGLAEVVKYGVIADAELFSWLEDNVDSVLSKDDAALAHIIKRSCEIKADVVAQDEREGGIRAILNYGHTFGHAIENLAGYGKWLHGEAVAVGMVMAAQFSERENRLQQGVAARIEDLLAAFNLPVRLHDPVDPDAMIEAMGMDKKTLDGQIRFILADEMGKVDVVADYASQNLKQTLDAFCVGDV